MTPEPKARAEPETIQMIPLAQIRPFPDHPFQVRDDELMQDTVDSIQKVGILNPVILRSDDNGGYEMISGHRRMYAADFIGMKEIPAIVRDMTDDEAVIFMVDSNLQREEILPSERAKAYKMKLEAIKRQAGRPAKENGDHVGHHLSSKKSVEIIADESGASKSQVQRFIRLNELHPTLHQLVDIQYLLVNAPFNEHNFYTLFMMLENSLMAEENDETDLAAGLLAKDSQNYRFTEGFFYGEYLFFEKICSDKKKAVEISKKLIEDVCDDLDIEIHED